MLNRTAVWPSSAIVPAEQRTPEYLASFLPKDIERWGKVIRDAGPEVLRGSDGWGWPDPRMTAGSTCFGPEHQPCTQSQVTLLRAHGPSDGHCMPTGRHKRSRPKRGRYVLRCIEEAQ